MSPDRELDIVIYGATGFVGRLTTEYLAARPSDGARVALAGRSRERLEAVRAELGPGAADWDVRVADTGEPAALRALAASTRVLASTVGPYRRHGLPVVEACAQAGTHYADLTGEVLFMRDSIDRAHARAAATGARIVHGCGFDSIPSDLGVLLVHEAAQADGAGSLEATTLVVRGISGGLSGGTLASMQGMLDDARSSAEARRTMTDPYALSPARASEPDLGPQRDLVVAEYDRDIGMWLAPFVMAAINTRVVRRSNALQDWAYGRRFRYREAMGFSGPAAPVMAGAVAAATVSMAAGLAFPPSRALLGRLLPGPGEGPSERTRRRGYFRLETHARTSTGARYVCRMSAPGDPGYQATAVMLGEAVLCLLRDEARLPDAAGVLTPATAMGTVLADRLRAAGQPYDVARP